VRVFLRCMPSMLAGMSGAVPLGISMQEREAALRVLGVPQPRWPEVDADVQFLWDEISALA
jgi:hypothetical protein